MRSKYGNKTAYVDEIMFDSRKEARYYLYLKDLEKKGKIQDLRLQVPFEIVPTIYENKIVHLKTKDKIVQRVAQSAVHYVADFVYTEDGDMVVVDAKSEATRKNAVYVLKKKMMRAFLGITIVEV